ncbi:MAG: LysR family transcriptional regulator [Caulobacteraceae bacterium]
MSDRGPPFAALRALEAACRLKSYSLAGEELGVTHSAVSQSMRRLEMTYGQRLFPSPGSGHGADGLRRRRCRSPIARRPASSPTPPSR